jgi:hypothetical protein
MERPLVDSVSVPFLGDESFSMTSFDGSGMLVTWTTELTPVAFLKICVTRMENATLDVLFGDESVDQVFGENILSSVESKGALSFKLTDPTVKDAISYSAAQPFNVVTIVTPDWVLDGENRLGTSHLLSMISSTGSANVCNLFLADIERLLTRATN